MTPEKLTKNFQRCKDWEERYLYLIELGERLESYPEEQLTDEHKVRGCQSQVWLNLSENTGDRVVRFYAFSDAAIVSGLLALLAIAYNEKTAEQILAFDIEEWFTSLDLKSHLTPSRTQGLDAIVARIKYQANQLMTA
ncbi:cysteine desulfuration protein SufE [Vibrio sonorensis]|uniref:cysteine desulfuration protein SufE n=1 Tax=Vibrio sonorensis TaxID=1004316 RepID=UPI0008D99CC8|nr:cysteine desulfuration protein SufE [Vibrio sonorensis]